MNFESLTSSKQNPLHNLGLRMPIISYAIFKMFHLIFKTIYMRNPENTAWVFEKKPIQDILFSILFWFFGVGLPFFLVV